MDNPERITYFAETDARNQRVKFGIKAKDRARHMYVIGKTGMGKSTLLENMAIQDIQNGEGMAFIDPHGSTAERLLDYVPEERVKDVLYFAPFDMDYPIAFNVMEDVGYDKRHLVVSGLMSVFKKIWVDAWSARMEYILSNTLLALLEYPDSTLLDVNRMLIDKAYRKQVVEYTTDPIVKSFWQDEFANYSDRYTQDATPAIQNKIGQFTSNPLIRNIVGQPTSTFDLREMMDARKIFIANLSKGRIGETNATLLGSMLTTKIYLAAMSRADSPEAVLSRLPPFYFYVDEFQSVANESFADILSEARKYKLALTLAHQYIEQMEEEVRDAVFGNVGTTLSFRVGPLDAELLEKIFSPRFFIQDLVSLGFAQIYLTLMIDGVGSQPFSATTLPLIEKPRLSYRDQIIGQSRKQFARPRPEVETEIRERSRPPQAEEVSKDKKREEPRRSEASGVVRRKGGERPPMRRERSEGTRTPRGDAGRREVPREKETSSPDAPKPPHEVSSRGPRPEELSKILSERIRKSQQNMERQKQKASAPDHREALKSALSNLLSKHVPSDAPAVPQTTPAPKSETTTPAPRSHVGTPHHPTPPKKPPEVPEDVLRKLLRVDEKP